MGSGVVHWRMLPQSDKPRGKDNPTPLPSIYEPTPVRRPHRLGSVHVLSPKPEATDAAPR